MYVYVREKNEVLVRAFSDISLWDSSAEFIVSTRVATLRLA